VVDNSVILAVLGFVFLYFMSVVVLTLVLIASGLDLTAALTATVASINNAGRASASSVPRRTIRAE